MKQMEVELVLLNNKIKDNKILSCKLIKNLFKIYLREAKLIVDAIVQTDTILPNIPRNIEIEQINFEDLENIIYNMDYLKLINSLKLNRVYVIEEGKLHQNLQKGIPSENGESLKNLIFNQKNTVIMNNMTPVVVSQENREKAKSIYLKAKNTLESLKSIDEIQLKTSGQFKPLNIDIIQCKSVHKLLEVAGLIIMRAKEYELASKYFKLSKFPAFNISGYTEKDWLHDLELCVKKLSVQKEKEHAEAAIKEMQPYMDADIHAESAFEKFSNFM